MLICHAIKRLSVYLFANNDVNYGDATVINLCSFTAHFVSAVVV